MGIFDKANLIELTQEDLQDAKTTAGLFQDELVKRRAFANVIAARSALKLLFSLNIEATNLYSMYSINKVLERLDIADVYAGSIRIDARLVDNVGEIFIPKSHFELGITPDLYLILRLEKGMTGVEFLGCVNPDEMDKTRENKDYYFVDEDLLYNLKIFKNLVKNNQGKQDYVPTPEDIERASNLIVPLEDGDIFNADYEFLMKQLAFNQDLRKKTVEFENFEFVSRKVVTDETVYGDSVLGLVGSEKLYDRNEFSTDIDLEGLSNSTVDDFVEEFDESSVQIPEMDELTGEVSLDDALTQMDESFELDNNEDETQDIIEMESSDDEHFEAENIDESDDNVDNLDSLIDEISDIKDYSQDSMEESIGVEPSDHMLGSEEQDINQQFDEEAFENENLMFFDDDDEEKELVPISVDDDEEQLQSLDFEDDFNEEPLNIVEDENIENEPSDDLMNQFNEDNSYQQEDFNNEMPSHSEPEELIESLPELDEDEEDDDDIVVDPDTPINFDDDDDDFSGFDLPDIQAFSLDDDLDESQIEESLEEENVEGDFAEDLSQDDDEPSLSSVQNQEKSEEDEEEDIKPYEDDTDIADLPTLKIFEENEETYKKKMYKAPKIDDIDMKHVNLDDFDDYETEDKEEEQKQSQELDKMMSDLDEILNSENITLDGVEDILTDEELNESLKNLEREEEEKKQREMEEALAVKEESYEEKTGPSTETYEEMEVSENSPTLNQNNEENNENQSMSLDDFLNSSFNDMSTNQENSGMMSEGEGIETIYQPENVDMSFNDDPERLLTDEAAMVDNSSNLYDEDNTSSLSQQGEKPKSRAPQLAVVLVVMMCACLYVNKDLIMENMNISFPNKAEETDVPEFDLNKLREPQPAPADSPIPDLPQPTDTPEIPAAPAPTQEPAVPVEPQPNTQTPPAGAVPQNTSNKITKLSWEVPENVANNQKIRKYLQIAGRTLKLSLQSDLLVATELPFSNKIMLDLKIAPSGNLVTSDFVISSGSKQIDNIVLQSVKDTLKYVRPPLGEIQAPNTNFTLIINF